jgi:hypothetical protein
MVKSLLALLLAFSACAATPNRAQVVIKDTMHHIVMVTHPTGSDTHAVCTGVIVGADLVLTVSHCLGDDLEVNGIPVEVIKSDDSLALLRSPSLGGGIEIRKDALKYGEDVVGIGWGGGELTVFIRHVALPNFERDVVLDGLMIPGMSGGPIVDMDGKLIGLIERGVQNTLTVAHGQNEIRHFLTGK